MKASFQILLKLIYSKKATKFCKISMVDLSYVMPVKSTVEILQNFVTFSEYLKFTMSKRSTKGQANTNLFGTSLLVAVGSSRILIGKQKLGVTFNSDKLGGIDFIKFSKLTMCSAGASRCWLVQWPGLPPRHCTWSVLNFL